MKFNVGDKVVIKPLEWYNSNKIEGGVVRCNGIYFVADMTYLCNNILEIKEVKDDIYRMQDEKWSFNDDMIAYKFSDSDILNTVETLKQEIEYHKACIKDREEKIKKLLK